jgi:hypothetical protein
MSFNEHKYQSIFGIVFCPREGEIAMLMITRRFDTDMLAQLKREEGARVPMGARLI